MMTALLILVLVPVALVLLVALLLVLRQGRLVYPYRAGPREAPPPDLSVWTVRSADHLQTEAWVRAPRPGEPVILSFHGNASSQQDTSERLAPLATTGIGIVAASYPGYGRNDGSPTQETLAAAAAAHLARVLQTFPDSPVFIHGWSLGTAVAVRLAVESTASQIRGVILEAPLTSIAEAAAKRFPAWLVGPLVRLGCLRETHDSLIRIPQLSVPLLWLHGTADPTLPLAMGQRLFDAAPQPKQAVILDDGDHHDLLERGGLDAIAAFVRSYCRAPRR